MRTIRIKLAAIGAALALVLGAGTADGQQEFPMTLYWGTGLIDIPVAWVPPLTGDFGLNYTGKNFESSPVSPKIDYSQEINSQLNFAFSLWGRFEIGIAAYSSNPEYGWFGKGLLIREEDFHDRGSLARWLIPSVALGARNVGPYEHIDRFAAGYIMLPQDPPNKEHMPDSLHQNFDTDETFYGVATKSFSLSEIRPNWPDIGMSFTVGYGNGLFEDDGGLGEFYSEMSTGGLFYGASLEFAPAPNALLTLMGENNAWDWNLGASLVYRGIRAGLYWTEVGAGTEADPAIPETYLYNYSKVAFTLGWQSNLFALFRGEFLQSRAEALQQRREQLLAEIAQRQQRIAQLELEINRYEAQNLLELEQQRAEAERQLRQEREALERLEERLRRIEQQQQQIPPRR